MAGRAQTLSPIDLLQDPILRAIADRGQVRRYCKNTVIINEGDVGDSLYIILSGKVRVYSTDTQGKEVVIDTHVPGEYVGEMALDAGLRSASVVTMEPCVCSVVTRKVFTESI